MSEFWDITLVYGSDAVYWWEYLRNQFRVDETKMKLQPLYVRAEDQSHIDDLKVAIHQSHVMLLLVTADLITYLEENKNWLVDCLQSRDTGLTSLLGVRLCVSADDLNEIGLSNGYDVNTWVDFELNEEGINVVRLVSEALCLLEEKQEYKLSKQDEVHIIPETAQQPGDKAILVFPHEIKGQLTVHLNDLTSKPLTSTKVNPYCVTFNTPEFLMDKNVLLVHGDEELTWTIPWTRHQMGNSHLDLLCQAYDVDSGPDLDLILTQKFKESYCSQVDELTKQLQDQLTTEHKSSTYPSMLHWAAANGLHDFTAAILDTPSGGSLSHVRNKGGLTPSELALGKGHKELAEFIDQTVEAKLIAEACEIYVKREFGNSSRNQKDPVEENEYEFVVMPANPTPSQKAVTLPRDFGSTLPAIPGSTPPPIPPRKVSTSSKAAKDEKNCDYVQPDAEENIYEEPVDMEPVWVPPPGAVGSRSQAELLSFIHGVKAGSLTMEEANQLFNSWNERVGSGRNKSFKERKNQLARFHLENSHTLGAIREQAEIASIPVGMSEFVSGDRSQNVKFRKKPSSLRSTRDSATSDTSSRSRDSGNSSMCSQDDLQEKRKSARDRFLELAPVPEKPPPVPPRNSNKPVTHSRIFSGNSPSSKNKSSSKKKK